MNAEELRFMITQAVKGYLDPSTIRQSENIETSGLRQSNAIREMFDQIRRFVDDDGYHEEALSQAEGFINKECYNPALHACLNKYWASRDALDAAIAKQKAIIAQGGKMAEMTAGAADRGIDSPVELRHRIRGLTLSALCRFYLTLNHDSKMESKETFTTMMKEMEAIVNAMKMAFEDEEENYHLVYNGTIYLYQCCQELIKRGYHQQAALFLGWCVRSCDSVLKLCATNFLHWRVRLYTTLAYCYEAKLEYAGAQQVSQWLVAKVDDLVELESLDVVPPSERQLEILNKAQDDAKILSLKYSWCAALVNVESESHEATAASGATKGGKKGKGGGAAAGDDHGSNHAHPTSATELLEKVKASLHPGHDMFCNVTTSLLTIASDSLSRLTTNPAETKVPAARTELNKLAAEALWRHIVGVVDDYIRRNDLEDPAWKNAEVIQAEADPKGQSKAEKDAAAKKAKEDAKKGAKGKGQAQAEEAPEVTPHTPTPPPTQLEELLPLDVLAHCVRVLYMYVTPNTFALDKMLAVMLRQSDGVNPMLRQEAELYHAMWSVKHAPAVVEGNVSTNPGNPAASVRDNKNNMGRVEACRELGDHLLYLCRGGTREFGATAAGATVAAAAGHSFFQKKPDLVEDAALLLLQSWSAFRHSHEMEGVSAIMEAVCVALVKTNHQDALQVGSIAVTASRFCGASEDYDRGVRILASVEQFLNDRQTHFVFTHNDDPANVVDTQAEQLTLKGSATTQDGLWLRNLRDLRTEVHRQLCALRLQKAIRAEYNELQNQHTTRVGLMKQRETESHLYGRLSKKETRAMATVEKEEVPKPHTIPAMETKLLAWSQTHYDAVACALAHCEIALCQKNAADKKKCLESALTCLQDASAKRLKHRKALKLQDEDPVEITTAQGMSLYLGWSVYAHYCSTLHQYQLVVPAVKPLLDRFVDMSVEEHEVWNMSLCSWDHLKPAQMERVSGELAQWLADGFAAIAEQQYLEAPYISPTQFVDTAEEGLDKRRYASIERERNALRAANTYLHALELAVAAGDDPSTMRVSSSLLNCLLPVLAVESPSPMVVRPLFAILHAVRRFDERRWNNGPLQLLAIRVFTAAMNVIKNFPEATQRTMGNTLTNCFVDIWVLVLQHPNEQQKRHLADCAKYVRFTKSVMAADVSKPATEGAATEVAAPAKSAKKGAAKGGKAGADKGGKLGPTGTPSGDGDSPVIHYNNLFTPTEPLLTDMMPTEYLDAFDHVIFTLPHCVALLEAKNEAANNQIFPTSSIAVASALQQSPQASVARLSEYTNDLQYVKLCAKLSGLLIKKRQYDVALQVATDGVKEAKNRHAAIAVMETDAMQVIREAHAAEVAAANAKVKETGVPLPLKEKASLNLSHRIGLWRRKTVFKKMRLIQRQYDLPWHATLQLNLSIVHFHYAHDHPAGSAEVAAASPKEPVGGTAKKTAASPKGGAAKDAGKGGKASAIVQEAAPEKTPEDEDATRACDAVTAATKALILFARASKSRFMFWCLQHLVNICRVLMADAPPAVLVDFSGGERTATSGTLSRGTNSSTPMLPAGPTAATKKTIEKINHVEAEMKLVCFSILHFLAEMEAGNLNPRTENDSLQPVAVRSGEDCNQEHGILHRTTTLHMWLCDEGQSVFNDKLAVEEKFRSRLDLVFAREQNDFFKKEEMCRTEVERDYFMEFATLTDQEEFVGEDEVLTTCRTEVVGRRARRAKISGKVEVQSGSEGIPYAANMSSDIPFTELVRCFMYAVQCLQYGRRKPTAIQLCMELNERTRNTFAVEILPFAINVQNATSVSVESALGLFDRAYKEQLRTQKLTQAAKQTWKMYQSTDNYKLILARLQATLLPTFQAHHGDPSANNNVPMAGGASLLSNQQPDAMSIKAGGSVKAGSIAGSVRAGSATSSGARAGGSIYREVVSAYTTAITYLRQKHSTEYLVSMLNELGTIHLTHRVKSEAERAWCDCADAAVGHVGSMGNWRTIFMENLNKTGAPCDAAQSIGLWKGLNAVCALGGLSMFVYNENQGKSVEACLFAAQILWQFNRTTLASPQRFWDENASQLKEALPGVPFERDNDLLPVLTHRLFFIASHLLKYHCPRQATTVARTLEYCGRYVLRSAALVTQARCLLGRAAAASGDFNSALNHCAAVAWGKSLPDLAFGHIDLTYDIVDDSARMQTPAQEAGGKGGKGKGQDKKDKGGKSVAAAEGDGALPSNPNSDMFTIDFDNSIPLSEESNLRALEHFLTHGLNSTASGLIDSVAAEYGPFLARQCAVAFADVLLSIGGSDPLLSWTNQDTSANPDATQASGKGGAAKEKGGKGAAAAADGRPVELGNACAVALHSAEKLIQGFNRASRPKSAGPDATVTKGRGSTPTQGQRGKAARGGDSSPVPSQQAYESPEEHHISQLARLMTALLYKHKGLFNKAGELLEELLETQKEYDLQPTSHVLNVTNQPSFLYAVDIRMICHAHILLAEAYSEMRRWDTCARVCAQGMEIASHATDVVSKQELQAKLVNAQLRSGDLSAAVTTIGELELGSRKGEWQGSMATFASVLNHHNLLHHDIDQTPHLQRAEALTRYYTDTKQGSRMDLASNILIERAESMGLNLPAFSDSERIAIHNPSAINLQLSLNEHAQILVRQGHLQDAQFTLREALKVAAQTDAARYPLASARTRYLLAVCLRLARSTTTSQSGYNRSNVTSRTEAQAASRGGSKTTTPRKSSVTASATNAPTTAFPITELKESSDERHGLLALAVQGATAVHDFELVRRCFTEWVLVYLPDQTGTSTPNDEVAAFSMLRYAASVAQMQSATFNDTSIYYDSPLQGLEDVMPCVVQEELEDLSRREFHSQMNFGQTMDRANPKIQTKPAPTLALLITYFTSLQVELRTCSPAQVKGVETKLLKVASYLASRVPAVCANAPTENRPPVFEKPFAFGSVQSNLLQSGTMKSFGILHQNYLAAPSGRPHLIDENGITKLIFPQVTLMLCLFPYNTDLVALQPSEAEATAGATATKTPAKGGAKAPGAEKSAAPAQSGTAGDSDTAGESGAPRPLLSAFTVDQMRMKKLTVLARALASTLAKAVETHAVEDKAEEGKGGKDKGGKKADAPAAGKKGAEAEAASPLASPMVSARTDEKTRVLDELRSDFLSGFFEMLIASRHQGHVPGNVVVDQESKILLPTFSFTQAHYAFLAELLDPNGAGVKDYVQDAELCMWLVTVCKHMSRPVVVA